MRDEVDGKVEHVKGFILLQRVSQCCSSRKSGNVVWEGLEVLSRGLKGRGKAGQTAVVSSFVYFSCLALPPNIFLRSLSFSLITNTRHWEM
jgi:hypothetical protein